MVTRRTALGLFAAAAIPVKARAATVEPEFLRARVEAGTLPPMKERLPATPRVVNLAALGRVLRQRGSGGGAALGHHQVEPGL